MYFTDKARETLQSVLKAFESGAVTEALAKTVISKTRKNVPMDSWGVWNRFFCALANTNDARGFRQWGEVSRNVKKGAKALFILVPMFAKGSTKKEEQEENDEDLKPTGFRACPVFRLEDTEGQELPPEQSLQPEKAPELMDVARKMGITVHYEHFSEGQTYYGYYQRNREKIVLATYEQDVFFHELAHAAHKQVLGEEIYGTRESWEKETVAELAANVIANIYGIDTSGHSYKYIGHFAKEADKSAYSACMAVLSEVDKVLNFIFTTKEQLTETIAA